MFFLWRSTHDQADLPWLQSLLEAGYTGLWWPTDPASWPLSHTLPDACRLRLSLFQSSQTVQQNLLALGASASDRFDLLWSVALPPDPPLQPALTSEAITAMTGWLHQRLSLLSPLANLPSPGLSILLFPSLPDASTSLARYIAWGWLEHAHDSLVLPQKRSPLTLARSEMTAPSELLTILQKPLPSSEGATSVSPSKRPAAMTELFSSKPTPSPLLPAFASIHGTLASTPPPETENPARRILQLPVTTLIHQSNQMIQGLQKLKHEIEQMGLFQRSKENRRFKQIAGLRLVDWITQFERMQKAWGHLQTPSALARLTSYTRDLLRSDARTRASLRDLLSYLETSPLSFSRKETSTEERKRQRSRLQTSIHQILQAFLDIEKGLDAVAV